ncbi:MAG: hypothetical protein ACREFP_04590 [Acetobacteraceae bacterium]
MDTSEKMERRRKLDSKPKPFRTLAEVRVDSVVEAIGRVGNPSNHQIYVYDEAGGRKVIRAVNEAVASLEPRLESSRGKTDGSIDYCENEG